MAADRIIGMPYDATTHVVPTGVLLCFFALVKAA
jgi:hypothetical protein